MRGSSGFMRKPSSACSAGDIRAISPTRCCRRGERGSAELSPQLVRRKTPRSGFSRRAAVRYVQRLWPEIADSSHRHYSSRPALDGFRAAKKPIGSKQNLYAFEHSTCGASDATSGAAIAPVP
jgi:hypothetical protein